MGNYANEHELIVHNNQPLRRWKIRRIRVPNVKKLRRINEDYQRICDQIRHLGYEELNPPVRKGYKRLFAQTDETINSSRAEFYKNILEKINTIRYSPDRIFKEKKKMKIRKWKYRKDPAQELKEVSAYEFHHKDIFTEEEKNCFYEVEFFYSPARMYQTKYIFKEPWRFELKVKPHYITKVKRKDILLEQRQDELAKYIERDESQRRLVKINGGNGYVWKKIYNEKEDRKRCAYNSLKNTPLYRVMDDYIKEKEWE